MFLLWWIYHHISYIGVNIFIHQVVAGRVIIFVLGFTIRHDFELWMLTHLHCLTFTGALVFINACHHYMFITSLRKVPSMSTVLCARVSPFGPAMAVVHSTRGERIHICQRAKRVIVIPWLWDLKLVCLASGNHSRPPSSWRTARAIFKWGLCEQACRTQ